MKISKTGEATFALEASRDELGILNNALNEVVNGVDIDDSEFLTRLGATRDEVGDLLHDIHAAVRR